MYTHTSSTSEGTFNPGGATKGSSFSSTFSVCAASTINGKVKTPEHKTWLTIQMLTKNY